MRARTADDSGFIDVDGVEIGYEVFGTGRPAVLLLPTWTIIHSRFWKMQVPWFAERHTVVTFDRPGNGRSARSLDPGHYAVEAVAAQALAVLDQVGIERSVLVSLSQGAEEAVKLAADHPDRVLGAVMIGPALTLETLPCARAEATARFFGPAPEAPTGWDRLNATYWQEHFADFADFFFAECFTEPHSTKQREDCASWASETSPEVLLADVSSMTAPEVVEEWASRVSVPTLVIQGEDDRITPLARAEAFAAQTGGDLVVIEGGGHIPLARDPVRTNLLLRDFIESVSPREPTVRRWTRGRRRPKRALYISSPIGLGHARRDVAIAHELRRIHPDLEIDWLAQHPVTRVLGDAGERVHPASTRLSSESAHIESESGEHRLHCFQAWRQMDEILLADFMVFHNVVTEQEYDLVIGDEAWEVDYFLHENPELKRFAYCWLTDFVGWLPMPGRSAHEEFLTADYNAEMIEHIDRHPRIRDKALFVGQPDDIVPHAFGADLPLIREWTEQHYDFPGYITGFDPVDVSDREALRDDLGYGDDEQVCIVTVGGSGVGDDLLRRLIEAHPLAADQIPGLRTLVVAGPRIDPASLSAPGGVEVHAYVSQLYRHLAACDLAVVQGGLTTCMELTASDSPFVYVPLRDHFEQHFHVHHRLSRHGAGHRMDYSELDPEAIAHTMATAIKDPGGYQPVDTDGAERAAAAIAELL
jgi:pimeloyl-ACP methyl ester carboxylesterase/predicted glycosyltransferase